MSIDYISQSLAQHYSLIAQIQDDEVLIQALNLAVGKIIHCFEHNGKVMFAGNGGSAADAQHMSAEFVSRFMFNRPGLPSIALTTDTSALTAIGNDYGFEVIFSRQIEAVGNPGDVLIAYSTSGTSPNILQALDVARARDIFCIGLTGIKPESKAMVERCDITLRVPHDSTPRIQEGHLLLGHILCGAVEAKMFDKDKSL
ncbi:SIS domain-containing protein [Endozoicomonas sp. SCSIO W0465]|uniref:D-sedoheptulose-7-phosphate isomerase n=1 Tax=Endozoicomonas sp. SCSIO W0465 TaxID=2918516 RepID=UPI0020757E16|nr:D-sedoheptulose 7-phosphate isomerase [Endozoicomonas sp. SCSIO W0465]USE33911.1 D-sedoheptulose 7-phosphate isomerase [Endozoicomonas sp. SCSIO W0465]